MLAKKIQPEIVNSIATNPYFENQKKINDENLLLQDEIYSKQLAEIDSLQALYKNVMLKTADNPVTGTSINLADEKDTQVKEIELINQRDVLKSKIVSLNNERANKANIINIISDFPNRGVQVKGIFKSY